jgi:phosphatidate cytidylyltransferase
VIRIATAAVGLPILFVVIKYLHPAVFFLLVSVAAVLATQELHDLAEKRGIRGERRLGAALSLAVIYTFADERLSLPAVLATAAIVVPSRRLLSSEGPEGALESVAVTLAGILFVGVPLGYTVGLMGIGDEMGRDLTVFLFLVVWLADAGAYAVGSWIGRHPISPRISPRKTLEGAIGGLAASLLGAGLAKAWFFQRLHLHDALALAVLLWVAGMAGDLSESLLKRAAMVKDCGSIFPGHGGMLDRSDSLLFGAPVLFFYYRAFLA